MGRVALTVNRLESEKADLKKQVADLQGRLASAAANALDADDLAALDAAEHDGSAGSPQADSAGSPQAEGQVS